MNPAIVALIGSWNDTEGFLRAAVDEALIGGLVLHPVPPPGHISALALEPRYRTRLDDLARTQIDIADEVLVHNPFGSLDAHTQALVQYALVGQKRVRYTNPVRDVPAPPIREIEEGTCPYCRMPTVYRQATCAAEFCVDKHRESLSRVRQKLEAAKDRTQYRVHPRTRIDRRFET